MGKRANKRSEKSEKLDLTPSSKGKASGNFFRKNRSIFLSLAFIALLFILASKIDIRTATFTVKEPITGKHTVLERVPYTDYEPYYVTEEYEDKVPFGKRDCAPRAMDFTVTQHPAVITASNEVQCRVTVKNLENATGEWSYTSQLTSLRENYPNYPKSIQIAPLTERDIIWTFEVNELLVDLNCKYYQESIPSMVKCFYAEPINYMIVKKTRTVERNKTVTKYRDVERITNETTYRDVEKKFTTVSLFGKEIFRLG